MNRTDIQSWVEYFKVLEANVQKGYMEVLPAVSEAYITRPALAFLSGMESEGSDHKKAIGIANTVKNISVYAKYLNASEEGYKIYKKAVGDGSNSPATDISVTQAAENAAKIAGEELRKSFTLHVVGHEYPHNLIYTIIATPRRAWWWPFRITYKYDVIDYNEKQ